MDGLRSARHRRARLKPLAAPGAGGERPATAARSGAGASTAAVAAAGLPAGSGIISYTFANWLHDLGNEGRRLAATDVLVLDEAAMVDDWALARLLTAANGGQLLHLQLGVRRQHFAVEYGFYH